MSNLTELGLRGTKSRLLPEVGTLLLSRAMQLLPGITKVRELGGLGGVTEAKVLGALVVGVSSTSPVLE